MKKSAILSVFLIGYGITLFTSCTKNLVEYNPSGASTDVLTNTPEGFMTIVNGAYSFVPYLYGSDENMLFLSEPGTDLWYNYNKVNYDIEVTQYKNFTAASNPVLGVWRTLYKAINQCNTGLGHIANAGFSTDERKIREAELRFLRGFYYWHVVETWGGVILDTTETQSVDLVAKRSSVDEFYQLITSDLNYAVQNLPVTYGSSYQYGRATKGAALGFLARAYLSWAYHASGATATEYFKKARDLAKEVIDQQADFQVSLYQNYADLWNPQNRNPDNGTKNQEALFVSTFSTNTALNINGNADRTHMWFLTNYSGYSGNAIPGLGISLKYGNDQKNRRFMPTRALLDFYNEKMDARYDGSFQEVWIANQTYTWNAADAKSFGKDPSVVGRVIHVGDTAMLISKDVIADAATRPYAVYDRNATYNASGTIKNGDRYVVLKKYLDPITRQGLTSYPGYLDVVVMRLAEMYLIAAEANVQLKDQSAAADMLNVLRRRAAVKAPIDYTDSMIIKDPSVIDIDFILDERAREMCGEYQRWFDLKRTGKLGERIQKYNPDIVSFQPDYNLRPIPLVEMQSISNSSEFKQNPGF